MLTSVFYYFTTVDSARKKARELIGSDTLVTWKNLMLKSVFAYSAMMKRAKRQDGGSYHYLARIHGPRSVIMVKKHTNHINTNWLGDFRKSKVPFVYVKNYHQSFRMVHGKL